MNRATRCLAVVALVTGLAAATTAAAGTATAAPAEPAARPLVVHGHAASETYPFLVYTGGCTGSLITAGWVVTAKHCTVPRTVRVGSLDRTTGGTVVPVTSSVKHPTSDIVLLRLANAVSAAPIPIPTGSGQVGTATRIIGWGQTCAAKGCGQAPTLAQEADVSIVADGRCAGINGTVEICTSNNDGATGACYGDSGGPQVRRVQGGWVLIGATSRAGNTSDVCATAPSIYSDLAALRPWIDAQVGGLPTAPAG